MTGDLSDPDRPRHDLKPNSQRRERAPYSLLTLIKLGLCIRRYFADYLGDILCCDGIDCDGHMFDLEDYLPGPLPLTTPADPPPKAK